MSSIKYMLVCLCMLVSLAITDTLMAQSEGSLDAGSIESQFDYLTKRSNNYREFKVVEKKKLAKLTANVLDSLKDQNQKIYNADKKLLAQQKEINSLLSDLETSNFNVGELKKEKNKISLFGISMNKLWYNTLLWSIIAGLICALLFFMFQFKQSHSITAQTKKSLNKLQDEFDAFRKRTLEKEQVLKRKLQDEINRRNQG